MLTIVRVNYIFIQPAPEGCSKPKKRASRLSAIEMLEKKYELKAQLKRERT